MPNANYIKGRRKEYKIVNEAKAQGKIAFRSAGSHSCVDVVIIDMLCKTIELVQCKPESWSDAKMLKLAQEYTGLNDTFKVSFKVV